MNETIAKFRNDILEGKIALARLVERAYVIAFKLDHPATLFFQSELRGYQSLNSIPYHRRISGKIYEFYGEKIQGLVEFPDLNVRSLCEISLIPHGIGEIENCVERNHSFFFSVPWHIADIIKVNGVSLKGTHQNQFFSSDFVIVFSPLHLSSICSTLRNVLLDWVLLLEKQGIKGEDFNFSSEEKEIGKEAGVVVNLNNFQALGEAFMGDQNQIGQAGIVGSNATGSNITLNQQLNQQQVISNLDELVTEIRRLRDVVRTVEESLEKDCILGDLANAERAAVAGESSKSKGFLSSAISGAKNLGVEVVSKVTAELIAKGLMAGL